MWGMSWLAANTGRLLKNDSAPWSKYSPSAFITSCVCCNVFVATSFASSRLSFIYCGFRVTCCRVSVTAPAKLSHYCANQFCFRSHWPRVLRRESAVSGLQGLRVRMQPEAWMFTCSDCCMLSGRGLCEGPFARPEEVCRVLCVWV
jgi:hypothetical protein